MPKQNQKTFLQEVILAIAPTYVDHGLSRIDKEAEEMRRAIERGVAPNDQLGRKKAQEEFYVWLVPYIEEQVQRISRGCVSMAERIVTAEDLSGRPAQVNGVEPIKEPDPEEGYETVTVKR